MTAADAWARLRALCARRAELEVEIDRPFDRTVSLELAAVLVEQESLGDLLEAHLATCDGHGTPLSDDELAGRFAAEVARRKPMLGSIIAFATDTALRESSLVLTFPRESARMAEQASRPDYAAVLEAAAAAIWGRALEICVEVSAAEGRNVMERNRV